MERKTTREAGFPEAILGADQLGMMEGLLAAISLREDCCLTYDYPYYFEDQIFLDVNGSDGYQGQLELTDKGWIEIDFEEQYKQELIESGIHRDEMKNEGF